MEVVGGVAIVRESAIAGRGDSAARTALCPRAGALFTGAGMLLTLAAALFTGAGAGRGLSTRGFAGVATGANAEPEAEATVGAGSTGASAITPSDCSTPLGATSAAGALWGAVCSERVARNAPAAPTVMQEAATTATVDVLISMAHL